MAIDYHELGQRIAARRKALGLRQAQVCERCGINGNYLSNIERAVSIPSLEVLMRICAVLDTTPDALLGTSSRGDNGLRQELTEQLRGLDRRQLALVKSFVTWRENRSGRAIYKLFTIPSRFSRIYRVI